MQSSKNRQFIADLALTTLDQMSEWICWIQPDGRILYISPQSIKQFGFQSAELERLHIWNIDLAFDPPSWRRHFQLVEQTGTFHYDSSHQTKSGDLLHIQVSAQVVSHLGNPYYSALIRPVQPHANNDRLGQTRNRVLEMIVNSAPIRDILACLVNSIEQSDPGKLCSILRLDRQRLYNYVCPSMPAGYQAAIEGIRIGPRIGSCGTAAFKRQTVITTNIHGDPLWQKFTDLARQYSLASCWSIPIIIENNLVYGTFAIYHRTPRVPSEQELQQLVYLSNLARIAIERHLAAEGLKLSDSVFKNCNEAMAVLDDHDKIIAVNPAFTSITGHHFKEVRGRGPNRFISKRHGKNFLKGIMDSLVMHDQWQGEMWKVKKSGEEYRSRVSINNIADEGGKLQRRVVVFSDITEKSMAEQAIWYEANYDALTKLPNRRLFRERLGQSLLKADRHRQKLALLFIDLDRFKEVNDASGHGGGDLLLVDVAQRLRSALRDTDVIARIGGDEFTIILSEFQDGTTISQIAQHLIDSLEAPFTISNERHYISASIGITLYPDDAADIDMLISNADQAMYAAKNQGRSQFCFFTEELQQLAIKRVQQIRDLRNALQNNEFELYYQPIINLKRSVVVRAEVLLRWRHKTLGIIPPSEFIPLAEETGLIHELGHWVVMQSIEQIDQWRNTISADLQISINLSPIQFRNLAYFETWLQVLQDKQMAGNSLCFEITESVLMDALDSTYSQLLKFRDAGIQVAIDDFGTGYSSLAYIQRMDVDFLKIDQSFVRNIVSGISEAALTEAIMAMAHTLKLKVIAEGVENLAQRDLLATLGCDCAQGYLYSQPITAQAFEAWVHHFHATHRDASLSTDDLTSDPQAAH